MNFCSTESPGLEPVALAAFCCSSHTVAITCKAEGSPVAPEAEWEPRLLN